jgi:hypothetical protein
LRGLSVLESIRLVTGMPSATVWVGTLSATTLVPLFRASARAFRPAKIALFLGADFAPSGTDYWSITVEKSPNQLASMAQIVTPRTTIASGLRGSIWTTLLDSAGMLREQTLAVRFTKVASAANLTGVALSYVLEVR